jgi:hypothetical protein
MPFGDISFDFTDNADLTSQLEKIDFDALAKTVSEKVPSLAVEKRQVREEIKDLVNTDGKFIVFKQSPKAKIDMVILAIYAYGTSATIDEIRHTTGVPDPSGDAINAGASRRYFTLLDKDAPAYGLSPDGLQKVTIDIIPSLRQKKEENAGKGKG